MLNTDQPITDKTTPNRKNRWLPVIVHFIGVLPLVILGWAYLTQSLGFNPVESVLRWTGRLGLIFLLLSLAGTPMRKIFKRPWMSRLRKPFGLYAAFFALLHFSTFAIWDYQLNLSQLWMEILSKPFIILGLAALIILGILAATSFRETQRKLGRKWVWIHRLVYVACVLVIAHYLLAVKGDLFSLQGAYTAPLIALGLMLLLFVVRVPAVFKFLKRLFSTR